jgi:signal transduction histidine kinase
VDYHGSVFSIYGVPLIEKPGDEIDLILVVERDITEEKETEKEIKASLERERELNNLKSRFVSIVSHEFRTPLSAIKSSAQIIEKYTSENNNDQRLKHTQRIQNSVDHLNGMIEDILSLSKMEEGRIELKNETFILDDVVDEIVKENQNIFPDQLVSWKRGKSVINSDRNLVKHILQNIISNAYKYTPDNKLVTIQMAKNKNHITLAVIDEGLGIPVLDQKKLFERFYRASNVQNIKGTGLGLNIVSKYLEMVGGKISFRSEENKGSEFIVTLPLKHSA